MKTLKELDKELQMQEGWNASYYMGYKTAIEWIFNDVMDSQATSVESIQKYLQDLLIK